MSKVRKNKKFWLVLLLLVFVLIFFSVVVAFGRSIPAISPEKLDTDKTTFVYDRYGNVIARLYGEQNRVPVPLSRISPYLRQAVIATEDVRFYEHPGVDLKAIVRALWKNFRSGTVVEGGSTITQQLVKNSFLTPEKSWKRKATEAVLALKLEREYSKDEILEMYLNRIYFGHGTYGVQAAAQFYFGKDAAQLNLAESAFLAGIPKNPTRFSPFVDWKAAKERQETVLARMVDAGFITPAEAEVARKQPLHFREPRQETVYRYPDYIDVVIEEASEKYGIEPGQVFRGGFRIYTALDPKVQNSIEIVYSNDNYFPPGKPDQIVQSAMVVIEPGSGEIRGLIGGRHQQTLRGLNRAVDLYRSPGSAFKPIAVYAPALEMKISPETVLRDEPVNINGYRPKNADGRYRGPITMRQAIAYSVNTYAVKLLARIGVDTGYRSAQNFGFKLVPQDKGLSLALGGLTRGVTPLQMAAAYGVFANKGVWVEPHTILKIESAEGKVIGEAHPARRQVVSAQTAAIMTDLLRGVVQYGTGTRARLPNQPVAGKTGTTELPDLPEFRYLRGNKDAWFVGYTPQLVAAVWMGYDHTDAGHYLYTYGGQYPAMVWQAVMSRALAGVPRQEFPVPSYKGLGIKWWEGGVKKKEKKEEKQNDTPQGQTTTPVQVQPETGNTSGNNKDNENSNSPPPAQNTPSPSPSPSSPPTGKEEEEKSEKNNGQNSGTSTPASQQPPGTSSPDSG
ncbi:MAG: penicillin-binding protein [Eubacteriales bacterium]|nr:penicillin-binding protein [Eubacteriales bacterium]